MHHFGERFNAATLGLCLLIAGLCLFVTGVVNAQTPNPSPVDAPQPGVRDVLQEVGDPKNGAHANGMF